MLFLASFYVTKTTENESGGRDTHVRHTASVVKAKNKAEDKAEALGKAYTVHHRLSPMAEGWTGHHVTIAPYFVIDDPETVHLF